MWDGTTKLNIKKVRESSFDVRIIFASLTN